jgi:hypothetical protein
MQKIETGLKTSVMLTQAQVDKLDQIAKRYGMKRAQAHRIILESGLDSYAIFEGTGMARLADLGLKVKRVLKKERQMSLI